MSIFLLILGIFLFIMLVIVHEFGHFLAARRNGVEVEEFGLFFPPRIWSMPMKSGFRFSINALPLGGFVKLKGEHDADVTKGSFGAATVWAKTKIMMAGVGMNLLAAFVIFTFLAVIGIPQIIPNQFTIKSNTSLVNQKVQVAQVVPDSPASQIGLKANDTIVSIGKPNGPVKQVVAANNLSTITKSFAGQKVNVTYINQSGTTVTKSVRLRSSATEWVKQGKKTVDETVGYLGVATGGSTNEYVLQHSTWAAPIIALGLMKQITILTFQGLGHVISGLFHGHPSQATKQLTGPIGVVVILKNSSILGYQFVLFVIGLISLSLAILNVLPIPALDGGRLFFTVVPRLFTGKPIKQSTEEWINGVGMVIIFLIFIAISVSDISRL